MIQAGAIERALEQGAFTVAFETTPFDVRHPCIFVELTMPPHLSLKLARGRSPYFPVFMLYYYTRVIMSISLFVLLDSDKVFMVGVPRFLLSQGIDRLGGAFRIPLFFG